MNTPENYRLLERNEDSFQLGDEYEMHPNVWQTIDPSSVGRKYTSGYKLHRRTLTPTIPGLPEGLPVPPDAPEGHYGVYRGMGWESTGEVLYSSLHSNLPDWRTSSSPSQTRGYPDQHYIEWVPIKEQAAQIVPPEGYQFWGMDCDYKCVKLFDDDEDLKNINVIQFHMGRWIIRLDEPIKGGLPTALRIGSKVHAANFPQQAAEAASVPPVGVAREWWAVMDGLLSDGVGALYDKQQLQGGLFPVKNQIRVREILPESDSSEPHGIEAQVCEDIAKRQRTGMAKYGVSVASNPLSLTEWLQHLYEELLDASVYLRRAMEEVPESGQAEEAWKPIESAPKGRKIRCWVRTKTKEETYMDTSGNPILGKGEPHHHDGEFGTWSSLWTATHWMEIPKIVPPVTPPPPAFDWSALWDQLPSWINWVAMDYDGDWWALKNQPDIDPDSDTWRQREVNAWVIPSNVAPPAMPDWTTSLVERPGK